MKKMTKLIALPLILALGAGFASVASAAGNDCNAKRGAIENQIREAQKYGNSNKVAGLQKALNELQAHCTDSGLAAKGQQKIDKLERKLAQKQNDVSKVQADLGEAQARGDAKKVAKYEKKLQEKQSDVNEITADLRQARSELAALQG
jgi:chromosome segregation ATPase